MSTADVTQAVAHNFRIVRGDSYLAVDGRQLTFTNPDGDWPDLSGIELLEPTVAITFTARNGDETLAAEGTVTTDKAEPGAEQQVVIDLEKEKTADLSLGRWNYDVQTVIKRTRVRVADKKTIRAEDPVTLMIGVVEVIEDFTR